MSRGDESTGGEQLRRAVVLVTHMWCLPSKQGRLKSSYTWCVSNPESRTHTSMTQATTNESVPAACTPCTAGIASCRSMRRAGRPIHIQAELGLLKLTCRRPRLKWKPTSSCTYPGGG